jgi:hypothetical protein
LLLNETGDGAHDAPFVKHNGPLLRWGAKGWRARSWRRAWRGVRAASDVERSGDGLAAAAREVAGLRGGSRTPRGAVWTAAVREAGSYEASLSANTASNCADRRHYALDGTLRAEKAADVTEDYAFSTRSRSCTASWIRRGPGAFASPFFRAFITTSDIGLPRGNRVVARVGWTNDPGISL